MDIGHFIIKVPERYTTFLETKHFPISYLLKLHTPNITFVKIFVYGMKCLRDLFVCCCSSLKTFFIVTNVYVVVTHVNSK